MKRIICLLLVAISLHCHGQRTEKVLVFDADPFGQDC